MRTGVIAEGYWKILGSGCEEASVVGGGLTGGIVATDIVLL